MPKIIDNPEEVILKHARDIVVNDGYTCLTMRKVSKNSGIAVGTIYNYFPTKDHLVIRLIEDYWHKYLISIDEIDRVETDFYKKLHSIYQKLNDFTQTFREVWIRDNNRSHTQDSSSRQMSFMKKLNARLEEILTEALSAGIIRLNQQPKIIAEFLLINFFMMSKVKHYEYNNFEIIIKKLFD